MSLAGYVIGGAIALAGLAILVLWQPIASGDEASRRQFRFKSVRGEPPTDKNMHRVVAGAMILLVGGAAMCVTATSWS